MVDPIRPDNPTSKILEGVLGLNKGPRSFRERIDMLHQMSGSTGLTNTNALLRLDPHNVATQGGLFMANTKEKAARLGAYLQESGLLPASMVGSDLSNFVSEGALTGRSLFFHPGQRALFVGPGVGGVGKYNALPLQFAPGVTSLGFSKRRSANLQIGNETMSFTEAFYRNTGPMFAGKGVRGIYNTKISAEGKTLKSLLGGTIFNRGQNQTFNAALTGLKNVVSFAGDPNNPIYLAAKRFELANAAFAGMVKTGGRFINPEFVEATGRQTLGASEAFGIIGQWQNDYYKKLPAFLESMGVRKLLPLVKPDQIFKNGVFTLPSKQMGKVLGNIFSSGMYDKGAFQLMHQMPLSSSQVALNVNMGRNPFAAFMTEGMWDFMGATGAIPGAYNQTMRVGVVDFKNPLYSQLFTQEGGAIFTQRGAMGIAAERVHAGRIKLSNLSEGQMTSIEKLFGVNLSGTNLTELNIPIEFSKSDVTAATRYKSIEGEAERRAAWKSLTKRQKRIASLMRKRDSGLWSTLASQGYEETQLGAVKVSDTNITLDFVTRKHIVPGSRELLIEGRRQTARLLDPSNPLSETVKYLGEFHGVDILMSSEEFASIAHERAYLTQFFTHASGQQYYGVNFQQIFGSNFKGYRVARANNKHFKIPIIDDMDSAFKLAKATVEGWKTSNRFKYRKLADVIENGTEVMSGSMSHLGVGAIRLMNLSGGLRADFMGDINIMKPIRFTPSKMQTMAGGSHLLGYGDPMDDPMYATIARQNGAWRSGVIGINKNTLGLDLRDDHYVKRYGQSILGKYAPTSTDRVFTWSNRRFSIGGRPLNRLPDISAFSHASGGVPLSSLRGTILDPSHGGIGFFDMGSERTFKMAGDPMFGAKVSTRHMPIPFKYLRLDKALGGKNGNVVVGRTHPSYEMLEALISAENEGFTDKTLRFFTAGHNRVLRKVGGKGGLLESTSTILTRVGSRVRLTAQGGNAYSVGNIADTVFEARVTKQEFYGYLQRKRGQIGEKGIADILQAFKERGFTYAMIGVDPSQRGEHTVLTKLRLVEGRAGQNIGQLNLQMNPIWFRMTERDTDRDVANMLLLEGMEHRAPVAELEARYAKQNKLMEHFAWYYKYDLATTGTRSAKGALARAGDAFTSKIENFLGIQKSLGYTVTRTAERMMPALIHGGADAARQMGLNVSKDVIDQVTAVYRKDPMRYTVASTLTQTIKQGAVQKATDKSSLQRLGKELTLLGQKYAGSAYHHENLIAEATKSLEAFLEGNTSKPRELMTMDYLVDSGLTKTLNRQSLDLLKADLERGSRKMLAEFQGDLRSATARLLAEHLAPSYAIAAGAGRSPRSPMTVIQDSVKLMKEKASMIVNGIVRPLAGLPPTIEEGAGTGKRAATELADAVGKGAAESLGSTIKSIRSFFDNPSSWKYAGIGAAVGIGAYALTVGAGMSAPLPPPIDTRQPEDSGPILPNMTNTRVYNSPTQMRIMPPSPRTMSQQRSYNQSSFGSRHQSDFTIRDKRDPMNKYLIQQRMKQVANSDYSY